MAAPIDPADLVDPRRRIRDREPFRNKASVIRNLSVGDELYIKHHRIPERSRVAKILRVSKHQLSITGAGDEQLESCVEWPRADSFRIDGARTFTITYGPGDARIPGLTFTLLG